MHAKTINMTRCRGDTAMATNCGVDLFAYITIYEQHVRKDTVTRILHLAAAIDTRLRFINNRIFAATTFEK